MGAIVSAETDLKNNLPPTPRIQVETPETQKIHYTYESLRRQSENLQEAIKDAIDEDERRALRVAHKRISSRLKYYEERAPGYIRNAVFDAAVQPMRDKYLKEVDMEDGESQWTARVAFMRDNGDVFWVRTVMRAAREARKRFWDKYEITPKPHFLGDLLAEEEYAMSAHYPREHQATDYGIPQNYGCYHMFIVWTACVKLRDVDNAKCRAAHHIFRSVCPDSWSNKWMELQEENAFPAFHDILWNREHVDDLDEFGRPPWQVLAKSEKEWRAKYSEGRWKEFSPPLTSWKGVQLDPEPIL